MKFVYLAFILFSCLVIQSHGQKNFQQALVVDNHKDSIRGFINIKDWEKNPESFLFKKDLNDPYEKVFTINDVGYFEVGSFRYLRHITTISMDPIKATTTTISEIQPNVDTVFLRVFQIGKNISLFSFTDELKTRYYIMESGADTPIELELRLKSWRDQYSVWHTGFFEGYKNQLANLSTKYGVMSTKLMWQINHAGYGDDLVKIASVINDIDSKKIRPRVKPEFHFYGGAGMSKSWLTYKHGVNAGYYALADNARSDASITPTLTAGFDFARNKSVSKLHFNLELMVSHVRNHTMSHEQTATSTLDLDYKFAFTSYAMSLLAQYNFYQTRKLQIFLATGVCFTQTSYSQNSGTYGGTNSKPMNDPFQLGKSWMAVPGKAGFTVMRRIQFYYMYFPNFWFMNHDATVLKEYLHNYRFGVNVVF